MPERYVICCNQFWQHKNHDQLFRGLAKTQSPIHLVCTGGQSDYRNADWFPFLHGLIDELELAARVTILGLLPRSEQVQLIRQSIGIIQPSLFEGWSTVLEDARGLGKPVLASNIAVHLEQSVSGTAYFDPASAEEIAAHIDRLCLGGVVGPVASAEKKARMEVIGLQQVAARRLMRVATGSVTEHHRRSNDPQQHKSLSIQMQLTGRLALVRSELMKKQRVIDSLLTINAATPTCGQTGNGAHTLSRQEAIIADQQHQLRELNEIVRRIRLLLPLIRLINRARAVSNDIDSHAVIQPRHVHRTHLAERR